MPKFRSANTLTVMPPAIRFGTRPQKRFSRRSSRTIIMATSSRLKMRVWLEDLLDREACPGLRWKDSSGKMFTIDWCHASSQGFDQSQHGSVFLQWAQYTKKESESHSVNKSTFRNALRSLKDCEELTKSSEKRGENARRTYRFIDEVPKQACNKKKARKGKNMLDQGVRGAAQSTSAAEAHSSNTSSITTVSSKRRSKSRRSTATSASEGEESESLKKEDDMFSPHAQVLPQTALLDLPQRTASFSHEDLNCQPPAQHSQYDCAETHSMSQPQSSSCFSMETNAEGILTIILPDQPPDEYKLPKENRMSQMDTLPDFGALGMPEYKVVEESANLKLTCGGHVKVFKEREPTRQYQFEVPCTMMVVAAEIPQQSASSKPQPLVLDSVVTTNSLGNGTTFTSFSSPKQEDLHEVPATEPEFSTGISSVLGEASSTLLTSTDPMFGSAPQTVGAELTHSAEPVGDQENHVPEDVLDDIFSLEQSM